MPLTGRSGPYRRRRKDTGWWAAGSFPPQMVKEILEVVKGTGIRVKVEASPRRLPRGWRRVKIESRRLYEKRTKKPFPDVKWPWYVRR